MWPVHEHGADVRTSYISLGLLAWRSSRTFLASRGSSHHLSPRTTSQHRPSPPPATPVLISTEIHRRLSMKFTGRLSWVSKYDHKTILFGSSAPPVKSMKTDDGTVLLTGDIHFARLVWINRKNYWMHTQSAARNETIDEEHKQEWIQFQCEWFKPFNTKLILKWGCTALFL